MTSVIAVLALSVVLNGVLLAVCQHQRYRLRQFKAPFDPKVSVYVQRGGRCGWVSSFDQRPHDRLLLSDRPVDAAIAPLSEVRGFANELVRHRFYVKVVRIVHPEHWRRS